MNNITDQKSNRSQTTLTMGVSQTILTKAPRFFGSPKSIFTELFQNSFRAGAKNVSIVWNPETKILTFQDDGCGCRPEDLVVVGESGWDENSPAIDPAGIGVFSILRPEYCERVTYRSRDWEMTITPENLECAQVQAFFFDDHVSGMIVEIALMPKKSDFVQEHIIRKARGRYPMNVFWTEVPKAKVAVLPEDILDISRWADLVIEGVGTVELGKRNSMTIQLHGKYAVWQYAVMESAALADALNRAARAHSQVAGCIFQYIDCVLVIDPVSGIRPKLPDRDDLIGDFHLDEACKKIVEKVIEYALQPLCPDSWPDRTRDRFDFEGYTKITSEVKNIDQVVFQDVPEEALIRHLGSACWGLKPLILEHFGYQRVHWDEITSYTATTVQDDGMTLEIEWEGITHYVRRTPVMTIDHEYLAQSLCSQGIYAEAKPNCTTEVCFSDLLYKSGQWVAFAKDITVNGTHVKWMLYDGLTNIDSDEQEDGPAFVTTLSPQEFYKLFTTDESNLFVSLVIYHLYACGNIYDYAELDSSGEYVLKTWEIESDLRHAALLAAAPELVSKSWLKTALGEVSKKIEEALNEMQEAKREVKHFAEPSETFPLSDDLSEMASGFLDSICQKMNGLDELQIEVRLASALLSKEIDESFIGSSSQ